MRRRRSRIKFTAADFPLSQRTSRAILAVAALLVIATFLTVSAWWSDLSARCQAEAAAEREAAKSAEQNEQRESARYDALRSALKARNPKTIGQTSTVLRSQPSDCTRNYKTGVYWVRWDVPQFTSKPVMAPAYSCDPSTPLRNAW